MASDLEIKLEIDRIVQGHYSVWTIGVTDDPARRKTEHGNPKCWHHWDANTETDARNVERYFLDLGMKGAPGGLGRADYVFIF